MKTVIVSLVRAVLVAVLIFVGAFVLSSANDGSDREPPRPPATEAAT